MLKPSEKGNETNQDADENHCKPTTRYESATGGVAYIKSAIAPVWCRRVRCSKRANNALSRLDGQWRFHCQRKVASAWMDDDLSRGRTSGVFDHNPRNASLRRMHGIERSSQFGLFKAHGGHALDAMCLRSNQHAFVETAAVAGERICTC